MTQAVSVSMQVILWHFFSKDDGNFTVFNLHYFYISFYQRNAIELLSSYYKDLSVFGDAGDMSIKG